MAVRCPVASGTLDVDGIGLARFDLGGFSFLVFHVSSYKSSQEKKL